MKLIKIEKDNCPACNSVGGFLEDAEAQYTSLNIQGSNAQEAGEARDYLAQLGLFTVPVTLVVDEDNNIVDHAKGADFGKLNELVEKVQ